MCWAKPACQLDDDCAQTVTELQPPYWPLQLLPLRASAAEQAYPRQSMMMGDEKREVNSPEPLEPQTDGLTSWPLQNWDSLPG